MPVARYVAAILSHPATAAATTTTSEIHPTTGRAPNRPMRAELLEWLGSTAYDADDATVTIAEDGWDGTSLPPDPAMRAFRDLRPHLYQAVRPLLDDEDERVRHAALVAAIPLAEHPGLITHHDLLAHHARRLLNTSTLRYQRDRALNALRSWGHNTSALETPEDTASRARYARFAAQRLQALEGGGYSDEPPF